MTQRLFCLDHVFNNQILDTKKKKFYFHENRHSFLRIKNSYFLK